MIQSTLAREGKVDVRRDEEQNVKLREILSLLVDAGYHRARIKGLSPFDKIVGGMTWCIEVCNFDVDIDLLFHDNLTIGQKISLTEKIVRVLPRMKCPHKIEPHQIQGLDSIHILPIIKWLVTLAIATRAEYEGETKEIALDEFNRNYCRPVERNLYMVEKVHSIKLKYGPQRLYKRDGLPQDQNESVITTLYEYDHADNISDKGFLDSDEESEEEDDKELRSRVAEQMVLDETTDVLFEAGSKAKTRQSLIMLGDFGSVEDNIKFKEREVSRLTRDLEAKLNVLDAEKQKKQKVEQELAGKNEILSSLRNESQQCEAMFSSQDKSQLEELSRLLEENEQAKKRASAFKEKCRQEAEILKSQISELQEKISDSQSPVDPSLINVHKTESEKLMKFRSLVGKKTREIESLKRIIDDVPGRAEISQYQRRFLELYNLVRAAQHETLQFYNMYNTLSDSKSYMEKEAALLNSVYDNMEEGLTTSSSLDDYLLQMDTIIDGIKQNKTKLEQKRNEVKAEKSTVSSELNRLHETQLLYSKMLHQFSQEIAKNEILLENLDT